MNMKPTTANSELTEALLSQFPPEAHKQRRGGGGKNFTYVETHSYIHRLMDATDNKFDWVIKSFDIKNDLAIVIGTLTIPGLGSRDGIGVQQFKAGSGEDLLKGCSSDAIKSAAKLFGMALYLYGPDYEDDEDIAPTQGKDSEIRREKVDQRQAARQQVAGTEAQVPPRKQFHVVPLPQKPTENQTNPPQAAQPVSDLVAAKREFAKSCSMFFGGAVMNKEDLWTLYNACMGRKQEDRTEPELEDWVEASEAIDLHLSPIRHMAASVKRKEKTMNEAKKEADEKGLPVNLFLQLYQATPAKEMGEVDSNA